MVVVNFPHNPTGVSLTQAEQGDLIAAVGAVGAYLVCDGAFGELTYDAAPLPAPCLQYERAVALGTMSKSYGLPGPRVGWCLASRDILTPMMRVDRAAWAALGFSVMDLSRPEASYVASTMLSADARHLADAMRLPTTALPRGQGQDGAALQRQVRALTI